ncbi:hypothetical protein DFH07DRAFT_1066827 [Mycena maculata]|uniref:Rho-GAP domain-containing protein n=1 Tax=Mycena maculata TaxID=230809 RepID=A0AAD7HQG8_9AGAR|nr:hypothetical protein DFH07DRAFT_1066827 [Mycena maculata]
MSSSHSRPGAVANPTFSATSSFSSAVSNSSQSDIASSDSHHAAATLQPTPRSTKLTAAPARSSSLTHAMGQNESKASLTSPSSQKPNGFYAAAATGSKLKRAFAARRKKSEDIAVGGDAQPRQRGARQLTLQVAQAWSGKKTKDGLSPISSSPPPPPPKPASMQAAKRPPLPPPPPLQSITPLNRASIIPITPGVSSAVNFMIGQEREFTAAAEREKDKEGDKGDSKEAWRRSDSTITHQTIRPGAAGTRTSRPVSTAESLQSTHTVVPVNKRLSALLSDADFGPAEEDDEVRSNSSHRTSPTASLRSNKPRSMSLNVGPSSPSFGQTTAPPLSSPKLSSETAPPMTPATSRETPTLTRAAANGIISPSSSGMQSTGNNIRGRLAAWTATNNNTAHSTPAPRRENTHQQLSTVQPPPRQPAVSISGGFAPAAGLAKRAAEKMGLGRAWGGFSSASSNSGYSSSSSSTAPSSYSSADYGLKRTSSKESGGKAPKHRRTPNSTSSAWSINSSNHSSSISDSDAFAAPLGPTLGKRLRGPLKVTSSGALVSGVVFGGRLKIVVNETAVTVGGRRGRDIEDDRSFGKQGIGALPLLKLLERRMLPALVVRCAQHLLIWGVQEEGLFRVTGRPSHISKLRSEFDTGADYDMTECTPGDLDPHAVASVFKAFLRELPEPILTQALIPYFEAALAQETSLNEQDKTSRVRGPIGPSLPSGPRGVQAIRKPPSLSTLAMPNFTSIRPPSQSLLNALKSLISQLPPENRDLIRTVTELIRATAKESRETKMPLSNLLLVFCPSLNMNPPLLRVLCEAEGVWGDNEAAGLDVVDIKRESVLDIRAPDTAKPDAKPDAVDTGLSDVNAVDTAVQPDPLPSPTDALRPRSPGARNRRMHPAAMYLDAEDSTDDSSLSQVSRMLAEDAPQSTPHSDDVSSVSTSEDTSTEPRLDAPSPLLSSSAESLATPSSGPSLTHLPLEDLDDKPSLTPLVIEDSPDPQFRQPHRPTIGPPLGSPIQFPSISNNSPGTPVSSTRPIPTLSLPSLSLASFSPRLDNNSAGSAPPSPFRRLKKPSLHLLFSKRSASPLTPSPGGHPFISGPYLQPPKAASDTSLSTPISAVTAPQGSPLNLPPVLDTPIESSPLRLSLGIDVDSPDPSPEAEKPEPSADEEPKVQLPTLGQTPIADWYRSPSTSTLAVNQLRPHPTRKISKASIASTTSSNRLGILDPDDNEEDWTQSVLLAADVDWAKQGP